MAIGQAEVEELRRQRNEYEEAIGGLDEMNQALQAQVSPCVWGGWSHWSKARGVTGELTPFCEVQLEHLLALLLYAGPGGVSPDSNPPPSLLSVTPLSHPNLQVDTLNRARDLAQAKASDLQVQLDDCHRQLEGLMAPTANGQARVRDLEADLFRVSQGQGQLSN